MTTPKSYLEFLSIEELTRLSRCLEHSLESTRTLSSYKLESVRIELEKRFDSALIAELELRHLNLFVSSLTVLSASISSIRKLVEVELSTGLLSASGSQAQTSENPTSNPVSSDTPQAPQHPIPCRHPEIVTLYGVRSCRWCRKLL